MRNKIKALVVKNSNKGDNNNYTNDDTLMSIYTDSLIGNMKVTPKILSMYSGHFILCWLMLPFIVRFLNIYIYIYIYKIHDTQSAVRFKCAQVHELPQSHCGDNQEGTLFS